MTILVDLRSHLAADTRPEDAEAVTRAFRAATDELESAGGGTLEVPPGTWHLVQGHDAPRAAIVLGTTGTTLRGSGIRATRLRLTDGVHAAVVAVIAPGVTIERLGVVGNVDRPPVDAFPHGIMLRAHPTFFSVRDVHVEDVAGYGIFLSMRTHVDDVFTNLVLHNVSVARCGNDGIDFKLRSSESDARKGTQRFVAAGPRAFLRNVCVEDHSLFYPDNSPGRRAGENGIDVRGQVHMENIEILRVGAPRFGKPGAGGINFRNADHGKAESGHHHQGAGADWSTLDGYFISLAPREDQGQRAKAIRIRRDYSSAVPVSVGVGAVERTAGSAWGRCRSGARRLFDEAAERLSS